MRAVWLPQRARTPTRKLQPTDTIAPDQAERELSEALERQAATDEVLRVISTSRTDVQPVFEMIVRSAVALCGSLFANVFRFDGELLHFVASHNVGPSYVELLRAKYPMRPDFSQVSGRVLLTKSVVRLEDVLTDRDCDITLVTYRGDAPALTDLLGGQVQMMIPAPAASIEYIRAGKLRALAVTTPTRWEGLPDIPTVGEFVPGYEASPWFGVGAPKRTAAEIVEKPNKEINTALTDSKMWARLADTGGTALPGLPADFGKLIEAETEKWAKVIRAANIKAE